MFYARFYANECKANIFEIQNNLKIKAEVVQTKALSQSFDPEALKAS